MAHALIPKGYDRPKEGHCPFLFGLLLQFLLRLPFWPAHHCPAKGSLSL